MTRHTSTNYSSIAMILKRTMLHEEGDSRAQIGSNHSSSITKGITEVGFVSLTMGRKSKASLRWYWSECQHPSAHNSNPQHDSHMSHQQQSRLRSRHQHWRTQIAGLHIPCPHFISPKSATFYNLYALQNVTIQLFWVSIWIRQLHVVIIKAGFVSNITVLKL